MCCEAALKQLPADFSPISQSVAFLHRSAPKLALAALRKQRALLPNEMQALNHGTTGSSETELSYLNVESKLHFSDSDSLSISTPSYGGMRKAKPLCWPEDRGEGTVNNREMDLQRKAANSQPSMDRCI